MREVNDVPVRHATIGTIGPMCLTWQRVYGHCALEGKVGLTARTVKLADSQFYGKCSGGKPIRGILRRGARKAKQFATGSNREKR